MAQPKNPYEWQVVCYGRQRDRPRRRIDMGSSYKNGNGFNTQDGSPGGGERGQRTFNRRMQSHDNWIQPRKHRKHDHTRGTGNPQEKYGDFHPTNWRQPKRSLHTPHRNWHTERYQSRDRNRHRGRDGDDYIESTDPNFGVTLRGMYKLLRVMHHLKNVSIKTTPGSEPPMILSMVDYLTSFIKPAYPNSETQMMIRGNAKNWGHTILVTLEEHYTKIMEEELENMRSIITPEWHAPFERAIKWARQNLGKRLREETIDHTRELIAAHFDDDLMTRENLRNGTQVEEDEEDPFPPLPVKIQTNQPEPDMSQEPANRTSTQTKTNNTQKKQKEKMGNIPVNTCSIGIMTETHSGWSPEPQPGEIPPDSFKNSTPLGPRTPHKKKKENPTVISKDISLLRIDPLEVTNVVETNEEQNFPPAQDFNASGSVEDNDNTFSTPISLQFKTNRHINSTRKIHEWGLRATKKYLIIGDANLSKFQEHGNQDLQIDSYPCGTFRHAESILIKATSNVKVEKIVLAFGINSRAQKVKQTTEKQLQKAVKQAKDNFPYAEIYIPQINFSPALPHGEQSNLNDLNKYIAKNHRSIPTLPAKQFTVDSDNIHWSKDTAQQMLNHWIKHLNLKTP